MLMLHERSYSSDEIKILFLGYAIPEDMLTEVTAKDAYPQIQGSRLIWMILKGLERSKGSPIDLISAVPASEYPKNSKIFFGYNRWKHDLSGGDDYIMPYINIIIIKHVTRLFSSFVLVSRWLIRNRKHLEKKILIYALHSPFLISALLATFFWGGKIILFIPDMPAFMDLGINRNIVIRIAKKIDVFIINKILQGAAGVIAITEHMANDIAHDNIPSMVMEGAVPTERASEKEVKTVRSSSMAKGGKIITYAGGMFEEYGVKLLLDAFALVSGKEYRLWLFGKGEMEGAVKAYTVRDPRIIYWGMLPNQELLDLEAQSTVLINPRLSGAEFTKYSFPSKLLEYMITGRPVVSTMLPGIPREYHEYLFILQDETPLGLAKLLQEVCEKPQTELSDIGQRARSFVMREKNYLRQGERMFNFIQSC
jgi:glycosyltransferase involved in cell wall biosynthesis